MTRAENKGVTLGGFILALSAKWTSVPIPSTKKRGAVVWPLAVRLYFGIAFVSELGVIGLRLIDKTRRSFQIRLLSEESSMGGGECARLVY